MLPEARNHWDQVIAQINGLWQNQYEKQMSPQLDKVWQARLGNKPLQFVIQAIDNHAAEMKFFPKLPEILFRVNKILGETKTKKHIEKPYQPADQAQYEAYLNTRNMALKKVGMEAIEQHKQTVCKQNKATAILFGQYPTRGEMWLGVVYDRVRRKIKPDEFDPKRVTKDTYTPMGNIAREEAPEL